MVFPLLLLLSAGLEAAASSSSDASPASPSSLSSSFFSVVHWLLYLGLLLLLVFLFILFILCRKRRDDATFGDALTSLDLRTAKLWIGSGNPTSPSLPFPSSPTRAPDPLSPRSAHEHTAHNHHSLLLLSNFARSLPYECSVTHPLPDIGHRSRRYYAQLADAVVDHSQGRETDCMAALVGLEGLSVGVDYGHAKRFGEVKALLLSLRHPNVAPFYDVHLLHPASTSSAAPPLPRYLFVTPLYAHGSLRDHLTSALYSHSYSTKYFTPASALKPGTALPVKHVRAFTRQLLHGLIYLRDRGIAHYHLHSGNVMLMREGRDVRVQLAGVENNVLGLKGRLHRKVKRVRGVDPVLCSLALTVYEMASGMEADVREGAELRVEGKDMADVNDFLGLITHAAHTVTLEELLAHRVCQKAEGGAGGGGGEGGEVRGRPAEGKVVRKVLISRVSVPRAGGVPPTAQLSGGQPQLRGRGRLGRRRRRQPRTAR